MVAAIMFIRTAMVPDAIYTATANDVETKYLPAGTAVLPIGRDDLVQVCDGRHSWFIGYYRQCTLKPTQAASRQQ